MARFFFYDSPQRRRKVCRFLLACMWLSGLLCGTLVYLSAEDSLISQMRSCVYAPVSIIGLLCGILLPFLFSAFAVYFSMPVLLFPICFGKAFLFSYISAGILFAFGSAGWLIRYLVLFGDCVSTPVLYWFWLRNLPGSHTRHTGESVFIVSLLILAGSIQYSVISPFLARLIE